jgi:hypothetical protein
MTPNLTDAAGLFGGLYLKCPPALSLCSILFSMAHNRRVWVVTEYATLASPGDNQSASLILQSSQEKSPGMSITMKIFGFKWLCGDFGVRSDRGEGGVETVACITSVRG